MFHTKVGHHIVTFVTLCLNVKNYMFKYLKDYII